MTDYELGFQQGEAVAWAQRYEPLPPKGKTMNEIDRGYWDARIGRSSEWERTRAKPLWLRGGSMRCKVGDLAVVVQDTELSNVGKLVKVIRRANPYEFEMYEGGEWECISESPMLANGWSGVNWVAPGSEIAWFDSALRHIRDQPGEDETLTWQPVPSEVTV